MTMLTSRLLRPGPILLLQRPASTAAWVSVHGANGSPYTRKLMSALRYKHVPFTFHHLMPGNVMGDWEDRGFGHIKPKVQC